MRRLTGKQRRAMVDRLAERDGWTCSSCRCPLAHDDTDSARKASVDHIQPVSLGGTNDETNLRLTCIPCNMRRGSRELYPLTDRQRRLMSLSPRMGA